MLIPSFTPVSTVWRHIGEALVLAPLPLAVADVEVHMHWAGYSLVPVRWDLHNNSALKDRDDTIRHFTFMASENPF